MLGFSVSANAVAYNAEIAGCENNTQLVKFRVDDSGWYYLSITFDPSNSANGWHFITSWQTYQVSATGGNNKSFFVVTDNATGTTAIGRCL